MAISTQKKTDRYSLLTSYSMIDGDTNIGITINSSDKTVIVDNTTFIRFFNILKDVNNMVCELSVHFQLKSNNYSSFTLPLPIKMKSGTRPIFVGLTLDDFSNMQGTEDIRFTAQPHNGNLDFTITSTISSGNNGYILYIKYLI